MAWISVPFLISFLSYFIGRALLYDSPLLFRTFQIDLVELRLPIVLYIGCWMASLLGFYLHSVLHRSSLRERRSRGRAVKATYVTISMDKDFNYMPPSFKVDKNVFLVVITSLLLILACFSYGDGSYGFAERRILTNFKFLPFMLILWGGYAGFTMNKVKDRFYRFIYIALVFTPITVFACVEGSRQAFLFCGSIIFCSLSLGRKSLPQLLFMTCLVFLAFVSGRNGFSVITDFDFKPISIFFQYPTGFSFGNFARQISGSSQFSYDLNTLLLNINPLPASLFRGLDAYQLFDQFSPLASSTSLYILSPFFLFLYWLILGYLFGHVRQVRRTFLKIICFAICSLLFLLSFQYSPRSTFRVMHLLIFCLVFSRLKIPRLRLLG